MVAQIVIQEGMKYCGIFMAMTFMVIGHASVQSQTVGQGLVDSLKRVTTVLNTAKKDEGWTISGITNVTFSQVGLLNWTAGGNSSISIIGLGMYKANYIRDNYTWNNYLELGYGLTKIGDVEFRKSDDRIIVVSQAGIAAGQTMNHSLLIDFRTQFTDGRNYIGTFDSVSGKYPLTSTFLAPAFLTTALGMEIKPTSSLSILIAPLTGRTTIVANNILSEAGAFNVTKGHTIKSFLGALINAHFNDQIVENVTLNSRLNVFSPFSSPDLMVVNWENLLSMKVNSFIKVTLSLDVFYDHKININRTDGTIGPATQLKNTFGVGFGYTF
ncbi:MAG: hypothetical protein RIT37_772 [Bacteroidota bacterium]|jgi:hypothetical protein